MEDLTSGAILQEHKKPALLLENLQILNTILRIKPFKVNKDLELILGCYTTSEFLLLLILDGLE